ncbi:MAG: hypothetical protein R2699_13780 [Acidimicrobiales bacterium]
MGSADDARLWLAASGRVVNLKPARVGGVAAAVALIDATAASPGRLFVGGMLEVGLGRTSAVAVAAYLAVQDPVGLPDRPRAVAALRRRGPHRRRRRRRPRPPRRRRRARSRRCAAPAAVGGSHGGAGHGAGLTWRTTRLGLDPTPDTPA